MSKVFALSVVGGQITALKGKLETVQNCTITTDKWGNNKAIEFTGNSYIKPVDDSLRNFGTDTDFTISFWAKYNGVGGGYDEFLGHPADFTQIMARSGSQPLPYVTFANNSSSYKVVGGAKSISTTDWHHIAAVRSGTNAIFFLDGVGVKSDISNYAFNIENVYIGWDGRQSNTWFKGIISDFVILKDEAKWTEDFTPPTSPLLGNKQLYLTEAGLVYGMSDTTFSKLSDNWSALTDTEKVALFTATNNAVASVDELKTIGTKFKVLSYADENDVQTCVVSAVPKDQIILPNKLINLNAYETVHSISMTSTVTSDTASVKVAFTKDLTTYIAYDKATATWVSADVSSVENFASSGMDISEVAGIPEAKVNELGMNGFAVALLMSKTNVSDDCTVSALTINVDKKAPWNKAVYGTDYTYGYPNTDVLEVKLLTNGSYKINYHAGESSD